MVFSIINPCWSCVAVVCGVVFISFTLLFIYLVFAVLAANLVFSPAQCHHIVNLYIFSLLPALFFPLALCFSCLGFASGPLSSPFVLLLFLVVLLLPYLPLSHPSLLIFLILIVLLLIFLFVSLLLSSCAPFTVFSCLVFASTQIWTKRPLKLVDHYVTNQ